MMTDRSAGGGTVTGRIHTVDGWPIADAVVTVTDGSGRQVGRTTVSPDGSFISELPKPGPHIVIVSAGGYHPLARNVVVQPAKTTTLGVLPMPRAGGLDLPAPGVWEIDPVHSTVRATAKHLGLGNVHGHFTDFSGRVIVADPPQNSSAEVVIQAGSISTSNPDRDAHLRSADFLDVERFPTLAFKSDVIERAGTDTWKMTGPFTMRDVTKPVTLDVTYLGTMPDLWGGVRAGFSATAELARDDFEMTWNQSVIAGITAFGRTLKINIDIQAVQQ